MSKYTTELRFICENAAGLTESEGYNNINSILDAARPHIFDFDFPIFDENYRTVLENKILKHYYTREIGVETVGLWKLRLDTKMNEIMPYYNQLYKSALIEFNPMYDVDLTTDHQKVDNGTHSDNENLSETTTKSGTVDVAETKTMQGETTDTNTNELYGEKRGTENSTNTEHTTESNEIDTSSTQTITDATVHDKWDMYSDTPQGGLNGVRTEEYLTNARHTTDSTSGSTTTTTISGNSDEDKSKDSQITISKTNTENAHNTTTDNGHGTSSEINNNTMNNEYSEDGSKTNINAKSGTIKNIQDYLEHVKGKSAGSSYSKMLTEFRETFLNIDMMIIEELNDLFMLIW